MTVPFTLLLAVTTLAIGRLTLAGDKTTETKPIDGPCFDENYKGSSSKITLIEGLKECKSTGMADMATINKEQDKIFKCFINKTRARDDDKGFYTTRLYAAFKNSAAKSENKKELGAVARECTGQCTDYMADDKSRGYESLSVFDKAGLCGRYPAVIFRECAFKKLAELCPNDPLVNGDAFKGEKEE